jgi:hypothetical protein
MGGGVEKFIAHKCKSLISAHPLDPTQIINKVTTCSDNNLTIATSN